jgi:hypothetical protein
VEATVLSGYTTVGRREYGAASYLGAYGGFLGGVLSEHENRKSGKRKTPICSSTFILFANYIKIPGHFIK